MRRIPRGSSSEVNSPARTGWAATTNSTVVCQCESMRMTVSKSRTSKTSARSRCRPGTRLISLPSLSSRRCSRGSMMVGTCARRPAPTTSPTLLPSLRRVDGVLDVAVEVEAPGAALAADSRLARAAERRAQVSDEEAVDPDRAGPKLGRYPISPAGIAGEQRGGQPVPGVIRHRDPFVLAGERLDGEHRPEHFLAEDLCALASAREQGRLVVQAVEHRVDAAAEQHACPIGDRTPDESVDPSQVGARDARADVGRLVARVTLA